MNRCTVCGTFTERPTSKGHLASKRHQAAENCLRIKRLGLEDVTRWERDLLVKAGINVERIVTVDGPARWGRSPERASLFTCGWAATVVRAYTKSLPGDMLGHPLLREVLVFAQTDESFRAALLSVIELSQVPFDANGAIASFVAAYRQRKETAP